MPAHSDVNKSPRFNGEWRWNVFAFARGVCLTALVLVALFFEVELADDLLGWRTFAGFALNTAMYATVLLGIAEIIWLLVRRSRSPRSGARSRIPSCIGSASLRAVCAALPLVTYYVGWQSQIPDRSFLWRHREGLEAVVHGADPKSHGFMGVNRYGNRCVIQVREQGVSDCYWLIHDTSVSPEQENLFDDDSFLRRRGAQIQHVCGPWYVLVS